MARAVVLCVESSPEGQRRLRKTLGAKGYEVAAAFSAGEAELVLNILGAPPDAAVIANALPGEGGLSFARRLRQNPRFARLIIVLLTENSSAEEYRRALAPDGVVNCALPKTAEPEELTARLQGLLALRASASPRAERKTP